eukprot:5886303-Prymnesium_polylepis.3
MKTFLFRSVYNPGPCCDGPTYRLFVYDHTYVHVHVRTDVLAPKYVRNGVCAGALEGAPVAKEICRCVHGLRREVVEASVGHLVHMALEGRMQTQTVSFDVQHICARDTGAVEQSLQETQLVDVVRQPIQYVQQDIPRKCPDGDALSQQLTDDCVRRNKSRRRPHLSMPRLLVNSFHYQLWGTHRFFVCMCTLCGCQHSATSTAKGRIRFFISFVAMQCSVPHPHQDAFGVITYQSDLPLRPVVDTLTPKQMSVIKRLVPFYSAHMLQQIVVPLVVQEGHISLRTLDWLVTNYAKKYNIVCRRLNASSELFNIYHRYKVALAHWRRRNFDPFRRRERLFVDAGDGVCIETTVGQLNFLHWAYLNGVLTYTFENAVDIETDMNSSSSANKAERKSLRSSGVCHKHRELLCAPISKCHMYNFKTCVVFDDESN